MRVEIRTDRLIISEHEESDLPQIHRLYTNGRAMYYLDDLKSKTLEETKEKLFEAIQEQTRPDREKYYFKISTITGEYIGEIGFTVRKIESEGKTVSFGYFILPDYWGKGIVTEAAQALVAYSFRNLDIVQIEAGCFEENQASEKIMKKIGMTKDKNYSQQAMHDDTLKSRVKYLINKKTGELEI